MIITLCGTKKSGKDTIADYFVSKYGFKKISFAETLKDMLSIMFRWDRQMLEGCDPEKRQIREQPDNWWSGRLGKTIVPRVMMQQFGTKVIREIHPDIFVYNLEQKINNIIQENKNQNIIITDCRFFNEYKMLKKNKSIFIKVNRKTNNLEDTHISEQENKLFDTHYTINNNKDIQELYNEVDNIYSMVSLLLIGAVPSKCPSSFL